MNLIVPADFTAAARTAVGFATKIAKRTGDKVILLHVYSPPVTRSNTAWPLDAETSRMISKDSDQRLGRYFGDTLNAENIHFQGKTRVGRLTDEIVIEAAEDSPSMIVMSTSSNTALCALFRGSNTSGVLESTRSPVIVLPEGIQPLVPQTVTFATDCQPGDLHALEHLISLCEKLNAEVVVLHVNTPEDGQTDHRVEKFTWRAREATGYEPISSYTVKAGDVATGLANHLANHRSDLLVFTQRKASIWNRLFKRSLAEKIIGLVRTPILLYPSRNHP